MLKGHILVWPVAPPGPTLFPTATVVAPTPPPAAAAACVSPSKQPHPSRRPLTWPRLGDTPSPLLEFPSNTPDLPRSWDHGFIKIADREKLLPRVGNQAEGFAAEANMTQHCACKFTTNQPENLEARHLWLPTTPRASSSFSCFFYHLSPQMKPRATHLIGYIEVMCLQQTCKQAWESKPLHSRWGWGPRNAGSFPPWEANKYGH